MARLGQARPGSDRRTPVSDLLSKGSAWLGSALPGLAGHVLTQIGVAWLSPALLGSARAGLARGSLGT